MKPLNPASARRPLLPLLCLALLSTGCARLGPDFQPPAQPAPTQWSAWSHAPQALPTASSDAPAPEAWWQVFDDPVLNALEAQARARNADLQTAALRFAQSRLQRQAQSAAELPRVDAQAALQRERQSAYDPSTRLVNAIGGNNREALIGVLTEPFNVYQAGFDVRWEPDLWGRVKRSLEAADAQSDEVAAQLDGVHLALGAELARAYLELAQVRRQRALLEEDRQTLAHSLTLGEARVRSGLLSSLELTERRARLTELESQQPALVARETQLLNQLAVLLDEPPGALAGRIPAPDARPRTLPALPLGLPAELTRRRPDLRAAEARLHQATASIGIALADLYPRIVLGAELGSTSIQGGRFGEWGSRQWQIGPSLSLPIFDRGQRRTVVELRRLDQQQAAIALQHTALEAWAEVDTALTAYRAGRARLARQQDKIRQLENALHWQSARETQGLASRENVLEARHALLQARLNLAEAEAQNGVQVVAVYKALGGGSLEPNQP